MITSISELKQRFTTGDMPSAKDFSDLIDTVVSIKNSDIANGSLTLSAFVPQAPSEVLQTDADGNMIVAALTFPVVAGGDGSISGAYPAISVSTDGIEEQHIANQAVSLRHFNQTEGSPNGYVLTSNGSGFAWAPVTVGSALSRVAASGAVRKFKSNPIPLPTNPSTYTTFNETIAHGLSLTPDTFRAALVCTASGGSAGYAQNKEVPVSLFFNNSNKPIFYISDDGTNIYINASFNEVGSASDYTMQVYDGTTLGNVDLLSMAGGDFAKWSLIVYADVYINGDGFGAVTGWTSTPTAFTVVSTTISPLVVTNTQGMVPNDYMVVMQCVTADGAYNPGDEVPITSFTNASYEPAFTVKANSTNFTISANCASTAIQIGSTAITALADWNLVIRAITATGNAVSLQAPMAVQLNGARTAMPYKGNIYAAHVLVTNQTSSYGSGTYGVTGARVTSLLSEINIGTGTVTPNFISGAFPTSDLTDGSGNGSRNTFGRAQLNAVRWPTTGVNAIMWIRGNDTFVMESNPVNSTAIPYGAHNISLFYPDAGSPSYVSLGAAPTSPANPAVSTVWGPPTYGFGGTTYYPYPQHSAIVQVDDSSNSVHPDLYIVGTQYYPIANTGFQAMMSNCRFGKYTYSVSYALVTAVAGSAGSGTNSAVNAPAGAINWLNPGIMNITARLSDIFASASSNNPIYISMVRYNPVKKLFYVIDSLTGMLHIYSLAVTLQSWLNTATGGTTNLDHTQLTYSGPYVIPIGPAYFDLNKFGDNGSTYSEASMMDVWTVEFDLVTGAEISLCVTRGLRNDIVRIPWTYPV
jgi:hypothetical protein